MITHRRAEMRDLSTIIETVAQARAAIATLGIDQWQDGYPEPEVLEDDIRRGVGIVFESDGCIAGYMVALCEPEPIYDSIDGAWRTQGNRYLTVHRVAIGNSFRRTGLGKAMLGWAEEYARECGMISVRADTHRGNRAMRGLLEKIGYAYCGDVIYEVTAGDPLRVAYEKCI